MRSRSIPAVLATAVFLAACSGPDPAATTAAPPTSPVSTTSPGADPFGGLPQVVVDGVAASMMGTPLEDLPSEAIAADVLEGCAAAVETAEPDRFRAAVAGIVTDRMDEAGEPPDGDAAARYGQALGAAFTEVCGVEYAASTAPAAPVMPAPEPGTPEERALEALARGLEGTPFEGIVGASWPDDQATLTIVGVCAIARSGGSNVEVFDSVADEVRGRYEATQGELDLLTVTIITVAVSYVCPEYTDEVLGP